MKHLVFDATSESDTDALGAALARVLPPGTTLSLCGTLGAGKTRLVQAIAEASGVPRRDVVSPTFVLAHEYHGNRDIFHLDAYRMRDEDEFDQLGPEEYFESSGLTLVEWADRVPASLPRDRIDIQIEVTGPASRRFEITALTPRHEPLLDQLQAAIRGRE
jgi:tRNA threonylcarbamoyladenosine biosynthesis protein TsaE